MGLPLRVLVEKTVHGKKNNVPSAAVTKKHADPANDITTEFLEKGTNVNSDTYSKLLRQYSPYLLNELRKNIFIYIV